MDPNPKITTPVKKAPTLYLIAICKLAKGVALLLVAVWILSLSRTDLPAAFRNFVLWVHLDPEHHFFENIADWLATVTPLNVRVTALATFLYGLFLLVGGTGLAIRAKWAIWLTIGESAFFIPIEILELSRRSGRPSLPLDISDDSQPPLPPVPHPHLFPHPKIGLAIVLGLNIIIVWYLLKNRQRLFKHPDESTGTKDVQK
jgi:uncharacterized membrane protein (DUF2068 family)